MNKNIIIGINLGDFGSTGNIMRNSLEYANKYGDFDYLVIVPKSQGKPNTVSFHEKDTFVHKIDRRYIHRTIGNPDGFFDYLCTNKIIKIIKKMRKKYDKVIIHLHNIHFAYIDLRMLFSFFNTEPKIAKVFYTIHDCWPFTGSCYYFLTCKNWQNGCNACPAKYKYSSFNTSDIWNISIHKRFPL